MQYLLSDSKFVVPINVNINSIWEYWNQPLDEDLQLNVLQEYEFYIGRQAHRIVDLDPAAIDENFQVVSLRDLLLLLPEPIFEQAARAWQYARFLNTHKYCGRCGTKTVQISKEMATLCPQCGHQCYPRVSPCIIVCVRNHSKILLAQGIRQQSAGFYSALAGFVESAESLEQAVQREVFEEVGIKIKNLRYFDSQPWPFPHSLMCGFLADYDTGEIKIDETEIISADWYSINALPKMPGRFSIARRMIDATIEEIKNT